MDIINTRDQRSMLEGITERQEHGMTILSPKHGRPHRRILYVNSYGMAWAWPITVQGEYPGNHLWGCPELVRLGYEVALPSADPSNPEEPKFSGDRRLVSFARDWLGCEGILYCAFNVLRWTALARKLNYLKCPTVGLLYGRADDLPFSSAYSGLIGMTPAGLEQARKLAPKAKTTHLGWGMDLDFYPNLPPQNGGLVSCGQTRRDHLTLNRAVSRCNAPLKLVARGLPNTLEWPANTRIVDDGGALGVSYRELIHTHYAEASASLVILRSDPKERFACGFTNILESLALGRPVIVTKTGALVRELDIEKEGCGLYVEPEDTESLIAAIEKFAADPEVPQRMGQRGRDLVAERYSIRGFSEGLHRFFESL